MLCRVCRCCSLSPRVGCRMSVRVWWAGGLVRPFHGPQRGTLWQQDKQQQDQKGAPIGQRGLGMRCWACSKGVGATLFCPSCDMIQPPKKEKNFFELFDCPISFDLDIEDLHRKYKEMQRKVHPDSFERKSELSLYNQSIEEGDRVEDPELLMEVMETREQIEEGSKEQVEAIWKRNKASIEECTANISKNFREKDFSAAKNNITRLQYLQRIEDTIHDKYGFAD